MNTSEFTPKRLASKQALRYLFIFSGLTALTIFSSSPVKAQGNLLITPRRVVFEGTKKSQDLNLANTGKDSAKFVISIVQMRMKDDGAFETITDPDPGQRFADPYLRFFPRTVFLGPNEAQVVKIQLTKASQLVPGEYRSHVYFRAIPNLKPLGEEDRIKDSTTISVHLTPIFGITIPVIIRVGESTTKVSLSDISFSMIRDTLPTLKLMFNRTGNMSVYGDLTVEYNSPQGKKTQVGKVSGIAVYTPNLTRRFEFPLDKIKGVDYHSGSLHIVYSSQSDAKPELFSETNISLH